MLHHDGNNNTSKYSHGRISSSVSSNETSTSCQNVAQHRGRQEQAPIHREPVSKNANMMVFRLAAANRDAYHSASESDGGGGNHSYDGGPSPNFYETFKKTPCCYPSEESQQAAVDAQKLYGDGNSKKPTPSLAGSQDRAFQQSITPENKSLMVISHRLFRKSNKEIQLPAKLKSKGDKKLEKERKEQKKEEGRFDAEDARELHKQAKQQAHPAKFWWSKKTASTAATKASTTASATTAASPKATTETKASIAAKTAASAASAPTKSTNPQSTTTSNNQNSSTTSPTTERLEVEVVQNVLNGKKISCYGYSDKETSLIKMSILLKGGVFVELENLAKEVILITQIRDRKDPIYFKCMITGNEVVNLKWLLESIKNAHVEDAWMYFPNNEMVSPEDCAELKQLMGRSHCLKEINISVSGFDPMENARIELIVLLNNGIFNRGMNSNCNYLIMDGNDITSEKYQAALKWGVKIVPLKWLESIHSMKRLPSDSVSVPAALRAEDEVNIDQELNSLPQRPQPLSSNRVEPSGDGQQNNVDAPVALENNENEHVDVYLHDISNGSPADDRSRSGAANATSHQQDINNSPGRAGQNPIPADEGRISNEGVPIVAQEHSTFVTRSGARLGEEEIMIRHHGRPLYLFRKNTTQNRFRCKWCKSLFKVRGINGIYNDENIPLGSFDENRLECITRDSNHLNCTNPDL